MSGRAADDLKRELERDLRAAEAERDRYQAELADTASSRRAGRRGLGPHDAPGTRSPR